MNWFTFEVATKLNDQTQSCQFSIYTPVGAAGVGKRDTSTFKNEAIFNKLNERTRLIKRNEKYKDGIAFDGKTYIFPPKKKQHREAFIAG